MIEAQQQIERFKEFITLHYEKDFHELIRKGAKSLLINFSELLQFDPELADNLLDDPEELIKAAELTMTQFDLPEKVLMKVRFYNLPDSQKIKIKDIRSVNLGNFMTIEGIVRQSSDVRPQVTSARFECPSCGNNLTIIQVDTAFKEPYRCSCGRRGKFRLLSKELVDAQRLVLEEIPETLEGGEQPKRLPVFLKEDLVEPKMERKTTPGSKVRVSGIIREVPITLKGGTQSIRYELMMDANYIIPIEETYTEIEIGKEEEEQIRELAKDPKIYQKLINSIAPSIYGHEDVKEAIVLQLFGGVKKIKSDGTKIRGDTHLLLVGDPGCISGDSQVALFNKGMDKIQDLGQFHLQPIRELVTKIRENEKDSNYDYATTFHKYQDQPVLKVATESGKEIICTYNQPLLTKNGWVRADNLLINDKIRVMPKIPNYIKRLADANFARVPKKSGHLKEVNLPKKVTPELASLYGYIIGDGNLHPKGYRVACYINEDEKDLVEKLSGLWKSTFEVEPSIIIRNVSPVEKTIDDGNGLLRSFISVQQIYLLEINSRQVAQSLSFLANKRVPQQIYQSPKHIISKFISWLFEADGCALGNGRGRTAIQLKSVNKELLKDVQLLLLYFGIHSRIVYDNLCIRRSRDMEIFANEIGFQSEKKKRKIEEVIQIINARYETYSRKKFQRYEKIKKIAPYGVRNVYDFEVPVSNRFIANGIVCHNSGKSIILQFVSKSSPKGRFISGKGSSAAGITASVVKDEFLRGWALEAGAIVLANGGILVADELDKMSPEDRDALHEGLEQQQITIAKANINATLNAETKVLAAANPKLGRFDPYQPIAAQIDLPPTLINRFDLIFPIRDIPNKETDTKIATHVLRVQQKPEELKQEIPTDILKKYISYAKQKVFPVLTDVAIDEIKNFYVTLRNKGSTGDESIKPIPISARQLEALVRLAEGSARVRLSPKVTREDAKRAIALLQHCLMQVGFDYETGQIDIDRIATGIPASERSRISVLREIINSLESKGMKSIPLEEITAKAGEKGITEEQVEEIIERLKRDGSVFEPRRGFISKI
ncbi:ATP-binding protein [Candidatus Woesearchaeota archaeon]|nr:ATP-binding protein [Candidatus Woesearchaeota archaeon]